jgi:DNA-binding NtrC family response regulator
MNKHILIVDDEASIVELLGSYLTHAGYRVTGASSRYEAEVISGRDKPDLIITDLQLENSDGLEMISHLKSQLPDTPVILLTGVHFDSKAVHENLAKKVSCYIEKTAPLSRVLEEVRRILGT